MVCLQRTLFIFEFCVAAVALVQNLTDDIGNKIEYTGTDSDIKPIRNGSEVCLEYSDCNNISSVQGCACDELCGTLHDCCPTAENVTNLDLTSDQFACKYIYWLQIDVMFVTKCSEGWDYLVTKSLCEDEPSENDTLSKVFVSDVTVKGLTFKNMHCAICNQVSNYVFWTATFGCEQTNGTRGFDLNRDCDLHLDPPKGYTYRNCALHLNGITSKCSKDFNNTDVEVKCERENTRLVYNEDDFVFKNIYCAECNGQIEYLSCKPEYKLFIGGNNIMYSFRMLVDFNENKITREGNVGPSMLSTEMMIECNNEQMYDPLSDQCRTIICPRHTQPFKGKCVYMSNLSDVGNTSVSSEQCTLSKVESTEIEFRNETNQILFRHRLYNDTEYVRNGSDIFLCISTTISSLIGRTLFSSDTLEKYLSVVGLALSIGSLVLTVTIYLSFTELLNVPGKNLVCLCSTLLIAQLLFLLSPIATSTSVLCPIFAVAMHFFFMSAFCWMNVIAFDLLMTFSNACTIKNLNDTNSKTFYWYISYAFCIPLLIVCTAVVLDFGFVNDEFAGFKPKYGQPICWISSWKGLLLFFMGPLAVFKLFDVIAFIITVVYITKANRQGSRARKGTSKCLFFIHLKVSCVMGLTWLFAFIANFSGNDVIWYLFIMFNTLQGVFIALSFLCTRKVYSLLKYRWQRILKKPYLVDDSTRTTTF